MKLLNKIKKLSGSKRLDFLEKNNDSIIKEKLSIYKSEVTSHTNLIANVNKVVVLEKLQRVFDVSKVSLNEDELLSVFVCNTYLWLDNHEDVHAKNLFSESLKGLFHQTDHEFKVKSRAGDVQKVIELNVSWSDLGIDKDGDTQVLVFISKVKKSYNENIYNDYKNNNANQHSVGMFYIDLKLAINDPLRKERYAVWKEYIDDIGNKEDAESLGYFYIITKAGIREGSYVLLGSNSLTPSIKSFSKKEIENIKNKSSKSEELKGLEKFLNINIK